ncbi:MAG: hypothetical protein PHQ26_06620 [Bacteroidales bacterium]|nr:hypothetical protein [Bacteroidales bacterium]MDD4771132.1 hypothetical protein [Bacteroidales bacterium]
MKIKKTFWLLLTVVVAFVRCSNEVDSYYDRPDWLEKPLYEELEAAGNFTLYLEAVDRTLQSQVLKGAGLYTCFAPNDEAFQTWMASKGYANVASIPQEVVDALVSYTLIYGQYQEQNLGSAMVAKVWTPGVAYKYKTPYYPMISREIVNGDSAWVFDSNTANGYTSTSKSPIVGNYKYLPVLTPAYFNASSPALTAEDYESFYPGSSWNGVSGLGNVAQAAIVGSQHLAENGAYYEVNSVVEPIKSTHQYLESDPDCSDFLALLDYKLPTASEQYFKFFMNIETVDDQMKLVYPEKNIDKVWIKGYTGFTFNPVVERYNGEGRSSDITQENGYTMFVPTKAALDNFLQTRLLKYYASLDQVPATLLATFITAQISETLVWPSWFTSKTNMYGEYLAGTNVNPSDIETFGVTGRYLSSNGIVYKTNQAIKSRYFETIFAEVLLNPDFYFMSLAHELYYGGETGLTELLMRCPLNGYYSERNTLLLLSDAQLKADGFDYDEVNNQFTHRITNTNGASTRMKRLVTNHLFLGYVDTFDVVVAEGVFGKNEMVVKNEGAQLTADDFAATSTIYDGWNYRVSYNGEPLRFKNNKLQAIGNIEMGEEVTLTKVEEYPNGEVFSVDRPLQYSERNTPASLDTALRDKSLWFYLDKARKENPNVSKFVDLVEIVMKSSDSEELLGIKSTNSYTVLMPTNTAMTKALNAALYPAVIDVEQDKSGYEKALRFLQGHFLQGQVLVDDNLPIIYPYSPLSDNPTSTIMPTILAVTNERLELINERTRVTAYKLKLGNNYQLRFYANSITRGNTTLVEGTPTWTAGALNHLTVQRAKATTGDYYRSNRMAARAILHEVNNYLRFEDK